MCARDHCVNHTQPPFPQHTRTHTYTGCTAWVTNRIPDPLKAQLRANQSLNFLWAADDDDGDPEGGGMPTHVLDTHYESPAGALRVGEGALAWRWRGVACSGWWWLGLSVCIFRVSGGVLYIHMYTPPPLLISTVNNPHKHTRLRLGAPRAGGQGRSSDGRERGGARRCLHGGHGGEGAVVRWIVCI